MKTPFVLCNVTPVSRGSMLARRSTLRRAKALAPALADQHGVPVGIWDETKDEYVVATWLPEKVRRPQISAEYQAAIDEREAATFSSRMAARMTHCQPVS
jgi:hypothetical protein